MVNQDGTLHRTQASAFAPRGFQSYRDAFSLARAEASNATRSSWAEAKDAEKQYFGMTEGQFRRTFEQAMSSPEPTGEAFLKLLESRLENVVYRLGFTPTRPMARQIVSHGHVFVNGHKVNIPSYRVSPGERITVSERAAAIPDIVESVGDGGRRVPSWLEREGDQPVGQVITEPNPEEAGIPVDIEAIISFYARM